MRRNVILVLGTAGVLSMVGLAVMPDPQDEAAGRLRVGVYDNRAVTVAFVDSGFNPVGEKMAAYELAKAAGDEKRVRELESWGPRFQRQLHRQGFGRVPVTDLLEPVRDRMAEVARKAGVDVIAFECNYRAPGVEQVDVTMELVMLFDPSTRTLRAVKDLRKTEPVDLDEIDRNHDH